MVFVKRISRSSRTPGARPRLRPASYPPLGGPLVLPRPHPPRTTSPLPSEIIALILDHITEHYTIGSWGMAPVQLDAFRYKSKREDGALERTTLASCCLVSRAFLYSARKNLYTQIQIFEPRREDGRMEQLVTTLEGHPDLAAFVNLVGFDRADACNLERDEFSHTAQHFRRILMACRNLVEVDMDVSGAALQEELAILQALAQGANHLTRLFIELSLIDDSDEAEHVHPEVFKVVSLILRTQTTLTSLALAAPFFHFQGPPPTFQLQILRAFVNGFVPKNFADTFESSTASLRSLSLADPIQNDTEADWTIFPNLTSLGLDSIPFDPIPRYRHLTTLPLRHLFLEYVDRSAFDLLPHLPPTLILLNIPVENPGQVVGILSAGTLPQLRAANFLGLYSKGNVIVNPWTWLKVARAAHDADLELKEPDDHGLVVQSQEETKPLTGQRLITDVWKVAPVGGSDSKAVRRRVEQ